MTLLHKLTGIWKQVDRFIALTDFSRQKILGSSLKLTAEQICVKPNFVADGGYAGPNERDNFFLYVGRLTFDKGIDVLLRAAQIHNFPLHIIGSGPMAANVQKMAEQVDTISYWGNQPRDIVLGAIKRCQALIVPSIWYEGLPTVILEAFASGTPVICSDQQNLNQIVRNGQTGLSFHTGDSLDLGRVVDLFRRDTEGRKHWSERAYFEYQTHYTSQVSLKATLAIYNALITEKNLCENGVLTDYTSLS